MSDPRTHTNDPVADSDAAFEPMLRDLRAMPKIDAPPGLEYQLKQKLAAASIPRLKWWQRLPALNLGFLRVPAFAYGPLAGAAVIIFSVYVFETREVLPPPPAPPVPTQEVQQETQSPEPPRPQSDPLSPASEIERKQREQEAARRRAERSQTPAQQKAVPAPDSRSAPKAIEQLDLPVLRGVIDEEATIDTTKKDSLRTPRVPPTLRESQQRTDKNPATRKPRDN